MSDYKPRPATPDDRYWQKALEKRVREALPTLQAAAEKWLGTISTITGVFSAVALIKGREDLTKLAPGAQIAVGVLLALALAIDVYAIYNAALAAQGVPRQLYTRKAGFRQKYFQWVEEAAQRLHNSRQAVIWVVVLLMLAIGVTWFGPTPAPDGEAATVVAVFENGQAVCGQLGENDDGQLTLEPAFGGEAMVLLEVTNLLIVEGCPE